MRSFYQQIEYAIVKSKRLAFVLCTILLVGNNISSSSAATKLTPLYSFGAVSNDGLLPVASLIQGLNGNLYGSTTEGGSNDEGTIFEFTNSGSVTILYSFIGNGNGSSNGSVPVGALVQGSNGDLYGTTVAGGGGGDGIVYDFTSTGLMSVLHSFTTLDLGFMNNDGSNPRSNLVIGADGNFYGTTFGGGVGASGTIFQISSSGTLTEVYDFSPTVGGYFVGTNPDGAGPETGLCLGSDGIFYGTCGYGGTSGLGTVFRVPSLNTLNTLHSFNGSDGSLPYGKLIQGSDGSFYGTTSNGGSAGTGTIFRVTSTGSFTTLYNFTSLSGTPLSNLDGANPYGSLLQASDGNFYGTTTTGGVSGNGTIFKISPSGTFTTVYSFSATTGDQGIYGENPDGAKPQDGLFQASNGNLYGTAQYGGLYGYGTLFQLQLNALPHRFDFNSDGDDDLLFQNSNGQTLVWDMDGKAVKSFGATFATVAPPWHVQAVGDINADGHPDLLWWNSSTGECLFWEMTGAAGTTVLQYGKSFASIADTSWRPVSMADFDGDGHPDILWENSATGQLLVWYMDGSSVKKYGSSFATLPANWTVAGTADFNQDGHPDLLLENGKTGQALVWYLTGSAGTTILTYGKTFATNADLNWSIVGTGDENGDGHPDLVWHDRSTGATDVWLMGGSLGTAVSSYGGNIGSVPATWSIAGVH